MKADAVVVRLDDQRVLPLAPRGGIPGRVVNCSVDSYVNNGWSADHFGLAPADIPVLADPDVFAGQLLNLLNEKMGGKSR